MGKGQSGDIFTSLAETMFLIKWDIEMHSLILADLLIRAGFERMRRKGGRS